MTGLIIGCSFLACSLVLVVFTFYMLKRNDAVCTLRNKVLHESDAYFIAPDTCTFYPYEFLPSYEDMFGHWWVPLHVFQDRAEARYDTYIAEGHRPTQYRHPRWYTDEATTACAVTTTDHERQRADG